LVNTILIDILFLQEHDVALLQLSEPVKLGGNVETVCLSRQPPPYDNQGVLVAWGKTGKYFCKAYNAKEPQAPPNSTEMVCATAGQGSPPGEACNTDSVSQYDLDLKVTSLIQRYAN